MNKEMYETPEMEVILFEAEDIIRTSGGDHDYDLPTVPVKSNNP